MSREFPIPIENHLLAGLPTDEYLHFRSKLQRVEFPNNRILFEAGQTMRHAYFLNTGMVSLRAVGKDGRTIQIGVIGNEGFVGVPIILMSAKTPNRVITQAPVTALRIEAKTLLAALNRESKLREILLRYGQFLQNQAVQSALCNPLHTVTQRLCRWLLTMNDRVDSDSFDLTQEDLADMLGKHRNLVSAAARELRQKGLIDFGYGRGRITLLDRKGLETASCECYGLLRRGPRNATPKASVPTV